MRRMSSLEKVRFFVLYLLLLLHNEAFATATVKVENEVIIQKLPRVTIPISYDIKIVPASIYDDEYKIFHGECRITVRILEETSNITLHSKHLRIDENFTSLVDSTGEMHKAKNHNFVNESSFLVIEFDQRISAGIYTLNLNYTGNISRGYGPSGIIWYWKKRPINMRLIDNLRNSSSEVSRRSLLTTAFYPSKARTAFPCWDEFDFQATFNLSIKHHPNFTAVSNTPAYQRIPDSDGKVWTSFETTPPMPVYRLGFVLSDYNCLKSDDNKVSFCSRKEFLPNLKNLLKITDRAIPILERYIGVPYTMQTKNEFVTPDTKSDFAPWSYSARGPVKYMESDLTDRNMIWAMEKVALTVTRTIAFEFLDDLRSIPTTNDSWIFEGLSHRLGYSVVDKMNSEWREMDSFVMMIQRYGFTADDSNETRPLESLPDCVSDRRVIGQNELPIDYSFIRGAALFHMISNFLTEKIFMLGIQEFVKKNSAHSITSDDLWDAMQLAYDKNQKKRKIDVSIKEAMKSWTNQTGYPILKVTRDYESGKVTIIQEGYPIKSHRFWIPITFATKSNPNFIKTSGWWLDPRVETYVIDEFVEKDDWIIFNIQQSGYYRIDYDEANWNKIAEYMSTKNYKKIHVRNRAQLLNDLAFMVKNGRQNITTFLNLARYLVREDDFTPWFPVVKYVEWLRDGDERRAFGWPIDKKITKFFLGLMENIIKKIDFKDQGYYSEVLNSNTKINKYFKTLLKNQDFFTRRYGYGMKYFACSLGHPSCLEPAVTVRGERWWESRELIKPPGEPWIFCDPAENSTEEAMLKNMENPLDTEYINYLFCVSNKNALWEFISKSLTGRLELSSVQMETALLYYLFQSNDYEDNNVGTILKNADAIFKYYEEKPDRVISQRTPTIMTASEFMEGCFIMASTPEQAEEIIDIATKNPHLIPLSKNPVKWRKWKNDMFKWQKDNFPKISKFLQDHPVHNSPVA